jgi:predicted protein tyrosine phosphatase
VQPAAAVLGATENTFHFSRCGKLRAAEAADLLAALRSVEVDDAGLGEAADAAANTPADQ